MENNKFNIKKVPVADLLKMLSELYETGVDYIDIIGETGETQDSFKIVVKQEYMNTEEDEDEDDFIIDDNPKIKIKLSDENLDALL